MSCNSLSPITFESLLNTDAARKQVEYLVQLMTSELEQEERRVRSQSEKSSEDENSKDLGGKFKANERQSCVPKKKSLFRRMSNKLRKHKDDFLVVQEIGGNSDLINLYSQESRENDIIEDHDLNRGQYYEQVHVHGQENEPKRKSAIFKSIFSRNHSALPSENHTQNDTQYQSECQKQYQNQSKTQIYDEEKQKSEFEYTVGSLPAASTATSPATSIKSVPKSSEPQRHRLTSFRASIRRLRRGFQMRPVNTVGLSGCADYYFEKYMQSGQGYADRAAAKQTLVELFRDE
ncbi:uncharacterized protein V1516DRAFT_679842 [Lipomyces oligophaga]|uniref:uncharacterized protein n=1 Tax=Lipomyces oligophaga TaxID=45792 RepID=UPI0034CD3042